MRHKKGKIILLLILTLIILQFYYTNINATPWETILAQAIPFFKEKPNAQQKLMTTFSPELTTTEQQTTQTTARETTFEETTNQTTAVTTTEPQTTQAVTETESLISVYGLDDIEFEEDHHEEASERDYSENAPIPIENIEQLKDFNYLKKNYYTFSPLTDATQKQLDAEKFLSYDFSLNKEDAPQILIFHTHSQEKYVNGGSVVDFGELLKNELESKYGVKVIHNTENFDVVNGKTQRLGAYERVQAGIKKVLKDNPTIDVILDIHRDDVPESVNLVTTIDGKPTAKIMFFNGMSQLIDGGKIKPITSLPNPNQEANLAFSFNMQIEANKLYSGFARRIYLNAYRYSLNMLPKSLLIEVGAQRTTYEEAQNAVKPLAQMLGNVLKL